MKHTIILVLSITVLSGLTGCRQMKDEIPSKKDVSFSATTGYESGTRTSFSGEVVGETSTYERIDWSSGDNIRVYSAEAATAAAAHTADYTVTSVSASGRSSYAALSSTAPLQWADGANTFYAFYPAPSGTNGATMTNNVVGGSFPSDWGDVTETFSGSGIYMTDMANHGYMYAVTSASLSEDDPVPLVFHPLMTAFEFTFRGTTGFPSSWTLKYLDLMVDSSSSSYLAGSFTAELLSDGTYNLNVSPDGDGRQTTMSFPGMGPTLSSDTDLKVTVLGPPMEHTKISVRLWFWNSANNEWVSRFIDLKSTALVSGTNPEGWITVPAGEKVYVNLVVPAAL